MVFTFRHFCQRGCPRHEDIVGKDKPITSEKIMIPASEPMVTLTDMAIVGCKISCRQVKERQNEPSLSPLRVLMKNTIFPPSPLGYPQPSLFYSRFSSSRRPPRLLNSPLGCSYRLKSRKHALYSTQIIDKTTRWA